MKHIVKIILVVIPILIATNFGKLHAAEFRLAPLDPKAPDEGLEVVLISGEIVPGDFEKLRKFARSDKDYFYMRMFVLASPGGDVIESIKIGSLLKDLYSSVYVNRDYGPCLSSCFFIYVSAIDRDTSPFSIGIHRPYFNSESYKSMSIIEAASNHESMETAIRGFLEEQKVPKSIIEKMFNLGSTETHWLTENEIESIGKRSPWWDQMLIDRCNLDKDLIKNRYEHGFNSTLNQQASMHYTEVYECAHRILEDDRYKNFNKFISN